MNAVEKQKSTVHFYDRRKKLVKRGGSILWKIARMVILISMSFTVLYPVLYMLSNAFKPYLETYDPAVVWIPKTFTLENIRDASIAINLGSSMWNSLMGSVVTAFIQTAVCMFVGYGFARFKFRGHKVMFGLVILTMIVPQITLSSSLYKTYRFFDFFGLFTLLEHITNGAVTKPNLLNTYFVTWLPALTGMGLRSGLFIFMYRQFFQSMPYELEEAAEIDGCNPMSTFFKVMLPNAGSVVLTVLLFAIVWNWNEFLTPTLYMNAKPTMAASLAQFKSSLDMMQSIKLNVQDIAAITTRLQAGCLLTVAPLLILYIFTQRFFIESVERTGLTGF